MELAKPQKLVQDISLLTDRQAEILWAYEESGGNATETARRLDISRVAVRTVIQRCRAKGVTPHL
jgi:DNA-directed RNA polymerase specialized sigma24 family protein